MKRNLDMVLTAKGLAATTPLESSRLGPPPPVRCLRCRHVLADCSYAKCTFPGDYEPEWIEKHGPPRVTHGAGTDVRAWWPACVDYSPGDGRVSPDAARWTPDGATP